MVAAADSQQFAKESEVVYQTGQLPGNRGIRTEVFKHADSDMRVVVCHSTQPLFTMNIYVPTMSPNNKGLPHTLEHLVFCGSKRFPHRGYLDSLANCNLAQGTNAWTYPDHTYYAISAASDPLLRDEHFITEVYYYDSAGREQGVVFSEMLEKENDEDELGSFALDRLMYSDQPGYGCNSGGLTRDIATLSNEEIIDYHRQFYDANNVTVVLTGPFSVQFGRETLQNIPADIIRSNGCAARSPLGCPLPSPDGARSSRVPFPSPDTNLGSVLVGWHGPAAEDVETLVALDILLAYLVRNLSSPLRQRFVERSCPLASNVSAHVFNRIRAAITINFSSVPYQPSGEAGEGDGGDDPDVAHLFDDGYFKDLLLEELRRIHGSQFNSNARALEEAAQKHMQRTALDMEENPSDTVNELICLDIVASHFSPGHQGRFAIGSRARMFDVMAELGRRPVQYWLDLLETWLIDAPLFHVVLVPDASMADRLDDERRDVEQANAAGIADKEAHAQRIAQAIASQAVDLSDELKLAMPRADPLQVACLPHEQSTTAPSQPLGPVAAVQVVKTDTAVPGLRLCIPMDALPERLRPYLMLYHGLMLCADIVLPAGVVYDAEDTPLRAERRVDYTTADRRLSELTSSFYGTIGIEMSKFSHCWVDELYVLNMRVPGRNFEVAVRWMVQALVFAEFTAERIAATAQNLLSALQKLKLDGDSMAMAASARLTTNCRPGKPGWIERHISLFDQERVLGGILDAARADRLDETIAGLDAIRRALVHSRGGLLALGIPAAGDRDSYIAAFAREWDGCISNYAGQPPEAADGTAPSRFAERGPFPVPRESRLPALTAPLLVHLPLKAQQASYARYCMATGLRIFPVGTAADFEDELRALPALDFYALSLLAEILQRIDGPLYNAVRGSGYAYGTWLWVSSWLGTLTVSVYRASDVSRAILAVHHVIADMGENWSRYVGDFEIAMARSTMAYDSVAALSTPDNVMVACIESGVEGFASVQQRARWRNVHLAAVTQADLRRVYDAHLRRLLDPAEPM
ncbi:hypothetical protein IWQ56_002182, partial [Coemansia nantahalensis]